MKKILKRLGIVLGSLVLLILLGLGGVYVLSANRLGTTYEVEPVTLTLPEPDSAVLARGQHVLEIRHCAGCHGADLGGAVMVDDPALGRLSASNLTRGAGGIGSRYTDRDWVRALRHGVGPDGVALWVMPSSEFIQMGREDLAALIAYLKQVPPVDRDVPENKLGPLGRTLLVAGQLPLLPAEMIDHTAGFPDVPQPGVTPAYGAYLAVTCSGCHGEDLTGMPGAAPGEPPSSNLRTLDGWTEADFFRAVREGIRPSGDTLHTFMPRWMAMTDDEIRAVWVYLQTLPPQPIARR